MHAIYATAIANKMEDAEEIEAFYEKEMENADREFLNNIKRTKNKKDSENLYKENIKSIRKEYERKYERYLKDQKNAILKERRKVPKNNEEKTAAFRAEGIDLKLTKKERLELRYDLFKFRFKIKIKNFLNKITPRFLLILYLKTRMISKRSYSSTREAIEKTFTKIKEAIISGLKKTGEKIKQVYSKIKKAVSSVFQKVIKKIKFKRKGEEDKKTEDQKLAEKILSRK